MIKLQQISAGYGRNMVLDDLSLTFEKGQFTSIVGPNSCGKSTLLKAILGIIPLHSGNITVDGEQYLTRKEIARKIAFLPQTKNTPDMTVEQLVLHGRFPHLEYPRRYGKKDYEIAFSAMEQVGIADYAKKPLYALSGGMRQTAYIAMALTQDTDYVLLDEPTTYLDISHQLDIMGILRTLTDNGKTILAVMHDLPLAFSFSDKILLLDHGKVVGHDTPQKICSQNLLTQVFGMSLTYQEAEKTYSYKYIR